MKDAGAVTRSQPRDHYLLPREKEGIGSSIRKISTVPFLSPSFLSLSTFPYTSASIHFVSVIRKVAARKRLFFGNETMYVRARVFVTTRTARFVRTWIRERAGM